MARRKKFDEGGSVMDKPIADMRDPRYRRQLEREQAIEPVYPELDLIGVGSAARNAIGRGILRSRRKNFDTPQIGSGIRKEIEREDFIKDRVRARSKTPEEGDREVALYEAAVGREKQAKMEANRPAEREARRKKGVEDFAKSVGRGAAGSIMSLGLGEGPYLKQRREAEQEREMDEGRAKVQRQREVAEGAYKKGGKVSAASKRGDGIAQRGKTKGRMV